MLILILINGISVLQSLADFYTYIYTEKMQTPKYVDTVVCDMYIVIIYIDIYANLTDRYE